MKRIMAKRDTARKVTIFAIIITSMALDYRFITVPKLVFFFLHISYEFRNKVNIVCIENNIKYLIIYIFIIKRAL